MKPVHPKLSRRHCNPALADLCAGAGEAISPQGIEIALSLVPHSAQ